MSILELNNVSIRYMTGDFKDIGLKEYVMRKLRGEYHVHEFWADRNISFALDKGDMLGIIGTNGAGKSTLLKVISGIMEPTGGWVKQEGSVAALLELTSGFDGDLTVRENAYLRGAMLGYTRKFMDTMYDQIIDFAELREFQDRPFKQLSSGMKSRLAFSIASLVEPDILILDEVLSVGDGAFRKKSETKMREIIAGGTTTILVSHSLDQIRKMCTKVLWLDHGKQVAFGADVDTICNKYQQYVEGGLHISDIIPTRQDCEQKAKKEPQDKILKKPVSTQKLKLLGSLPVAMIILAELFVMFFMSFPRLDDLTWGSSVGIQRLSTWFAGYNGRYTGNIIVIVLTRLPAFVRACVELLIFCSLIYHVHRLLPQKGAFCAFVLSFLSLPLAIHAQSVIWTAGFSNYVTSAAVMVYVLNIYHTVIIQGKSLSRVSHIVFIFIVFLGQLILENTTFYVVALSGFFLLYGLISKKNLYAPAASGLISAVCGAALMFSNSSYHSTLVGDGENYKSLAVMPLELWEKYQNDVVPYLVQNNHLLNLVLTVVLLLLWLTQDAGRKKRGIPDKVWSFCGIALIAFFAYDMVDGTWTKMFPYGRTIYAVIALLYAVYIITTICVTIVNRKDRFTLLVFAGSQVVLAAPLVPAAPLNARCFFQNGILWAMLLGYMLQILMERYHAFDTGKSVESRITVITQIICASYLAIVLCGQSVSWHIQSIRLEITQSGIASNAETIVLPEVPWSSIYCYGANLSNSNNYWLSNYKRYYDIPEGTRLVFMDYYKWKAEFGG